MVNAPRGQRNRTTRPRGGPEKGVAVGRCSRAATQDACAHSAIIARADVRDSRGDTNRGAFGENAISLLLGARFPWTFPPLARGSSRGKVGRTLICTNAMAVI